MLRHRHLLITFACILSLLAIFLRFWQLNNIPLSLYHDEMDYVITGEALARFGTDLSGTWTPWQLRPLHTLNYTAELPAVFHALVQKILGLGPQNGHTPAALFGVGTVLLVGWLVYLLTKNKPLMILAGLTLALNPWHIYISRMGYEAVISLFFQVLFLICLWQSVKTNKIGWMLGMIFSLVLGYFTYHATKFTLIFISLSSLLWILSQKMDRKWKTINVIIIIVTLGILLTYSLHLNKIGAMGTRQTELILGSDHLSSVVNVERRQSLFMPGSKFLLNKGTILITEFINHYAAVFDIYRIFISGYEGGFQFSLAVHGYFYLSSIPFLIMGAAWWWKKYRAATTFLLLTLVVSPMASAITIGYQSIFRSALTYTIIIILIAGGTYNLVQWLSKKPYAQIGMLILGLWLSSESIWFAHRYFTRFPLVSADNHYFYEEVLAGYVKRAARPLLVITSDSAYSRARAIVAYTGIMGNLKPEMRAQFALPNQSTFNLGDITVSGNCPNFEQTKNSVQVVEAAKFAECGYPQYLATTSAQLVAPNHKLQLKGLGSPIDSRTYYYLINDQVCDVNQLKGYIHTDQLRDYNPVQLSDEQFCSAWGKTDVVNY